MINILFYNDCYNKMLINHRTLVKFYVNEGDKI